MIRRRQLDPVEQAIVQLNLTVGVVALMVD